ncbi:uncharacterized protein C1orf94 isoform X2 [Vicugna pacos]|uniref:Uncharacterized protein C1orf94 isoform X2 n=1 Tax=Vicugna pacos TaxID=30538 RepID=A0ABM5CRE4_VICPA
MRSGGGWSPCLRALGGQTAFRKERKRMASGNGLASSSALVAKRPSALGPFPRYIWIHQDTPRDSLDKACHEIWKRVQGLPEALQPRTSKEQLSAPMAGTPRDKRLSFQEEALELTSSKDEISLLVEQEFLSLTKEHLILGTEGSEDLEALGSSPEGPRLPAPRLLMPSLMAGSSERSGASVMASDKLLEPKVAVSVIGSRQDCDSAMPKVTSILPAAKVKSAKGAEDRGRSLGASNMEIGQLLSQFPLKSTEMPKVPNEMVLEETRVIKDFLQNSMFSGPGPKEPGGLGPFLLLPPPPPPTPLAKLDKLLELPAPKKQLPVFAKICSKPEADPAVEEHRLMVNPPATGADKNNLKYTGNVFTPRFATALTSATLNQPLWLNLNYPPPPVFTNPATFPQYQGLHPQRAARMPYQQTLHPQLGGYSRQVTPFSPQQMGQQVFRSSYTPLLGYVPFVQPNYSYSQRTPQKLSGNPRDPSPMAGDGPQCLFPQAFGFGSTSGGPLMNSPYFSSSGNGINF